MLRKVFIDCGANDGCSVRKFKRIVSNWEDYEIYSFEPNPSFAKDIENSGATLIEKAVWIEDGEVDFFIVTVDNKGKENMRTGASTLNPRKNEWNLDGRHIESEVYRVESVDLSKWVLNNFSKENKIILKMDIEGSEYDVLDKMIDDGSLEFVDELWIEFHTYKCGVTPERHNVLNAYLDTLGIKINRNWDGLRKEI